MNLDLGKFAKQLNAQAGNIESVVTIDKMDLMVWSGAQIQTYMYLLV
jgi:hypothetical protein